MKKSLIVFFILGTIIIFLSGYRFTPFNAAKANSFITTEYKLLDKFNEESDKFYIFKSEKKEEYRTVLVQRKFLLYKSSYSTMVPFSTDKLQTIGGFSYNLNTKGTFLAISSNDEKVGYITINTNGGINKKVVDVNKLTMFYLPYSHQIDLLNATAYDIKGNKLYYLGYNSQDNLKDLKWKPIQ